MPTTFNNNLRIAEIGTGEQAGVWGNTTNYNLATLITEAITGVTEITITGDQALVTLDGVTDEARQAVLVLTGAPALDFILYTPPVNKIYIVKNSTGKTATITAAASLNPTTPQTGTVASISIPTGQTTLVYCAYNTITTKWDFYNGLDRVSGNLSVSGNGTFGGNGTFSGTGSLGLPNGTTIQRAGTGVRYNTTFGQYEGYDLNTGVWSSIGGGATGGAGNQVFYENDQVVTANYTIASDKNASTTGTITIDPIIFTGTINDGGILAGNTLTVLSAASFTASIAGNIMTVTVMSPGSGVIGIGQYISGTNVGASTKILSQLTGTPGDTGTYKVNLAQTVTSTTITTITSGILYLGAVISGTGITAGTTVTAFGPAIPGVPAGTGGAGTYTVATTPPSTQLVPSATISSPVSVTVATGARLVVL